MDKKTQHHFLLVLLAGAFILAFFVLKPFLYLIILALVSAAIFAPVHQKILSFLRGHHALAALITTILIIIIILIPFIFLGIKIFREAQQFSIFLISGSGKDAIATISNDLTGYVQAYFTSDQQFSIDADHYIKQGLAWLVNHLGYIFSSITKLVFNFFIFIIVVYYTLKDGEKFKKMIIKISPLADSNDEIIFKKLNIALHSVVKGNLVIALLQGTLTSLGFALFGVPNVVLWGGAATVASLIPGFGTALVLIPAVIFVFFTKNIFWAMGLLAWGTLIVGLVDNFLKPQLISRGASIHPLVIFLSVLGGIAFFGPVGFLLGPLAMTFLFTLLDIYLSIRNDRLVPPPADNLR